jgi:hypothetical protein
MSATHNFCTLFDSNYLPRALVMYHSLEKTGEDFRLYAVCFDDLAYQILARLNLAKLIAIPLDAFESPQLRAVKGQRTAGEYCWTCTSHVIRYVLDAYQLPEVTYLDADLCFYDRPSLLLSEFEESGASVLITEHRYTPRYDRSATSGIYCVQFMTFKADRRGIEVLRWWQDRCLEWCYARFEDGKFGDQKYLDDWTQRFEGIHVLQHLGGGVAPWNVQQYKVRQRSGRLYVNELPLVFYHFHAYKYFANGIHSFCADYLLSAEAVNLLYRPYAQALIKAYAEIRELYPDFNMGWSKRGGFWNEMYVYIKRKLYGVLNEYRIV